MNLDTWARERSQEAHIREKIERAVAGMRQVREIRKGRFGK